MNSILTVVLLGAGCALHSASSVAPLEIGPTIAKPISGCLESPPVAPLGFRHWRNRALARLGAPHHRGVDVIAVETDENQTVSGKLAYTAFDKDLEDEDVRLFACRGDAWRSIGSARTGDDGRFSHTLSGAARLPVGLHELFASVVGDGSGVRFLALVTKVGEHVIVTDVDGTLTDGEDAVLGQVAFGMSVGHRPDAPQALGNANHPIVYVTARGDQLTEMTRRWLCKHGFPPGPLRLARAPLLLPGASTTAYKTDTLRRLGVPIFAGIGNKHTDVEAYARGGVPASRIFIKLPASASNVRPDLDAHRAVGFTSYNTLPALLGGTP